MAKTQTQSNPSTVITITLPDEGTLPRTGQLLIQRGELGICTQFQYSDLAGISRALQEGAVLLMDTERNPPPEDVKEVKQKAPGNLELAAQGATEQPTSEQLALDEQAEPEENTEPAGETETI